MKIKFLMLKKRKGQPSEKVCMLGLEPGSSVQRTEVLPTETHR